MVYQRPHIEYHKLDIRAHLMEGFFQRNRMKLILFALLGLTCVLALAIGLGTGLSVSSSAAEQDGKPVSDYMFKPINRPAAEGQFEAGSNRGPGGRGWGQVGVSDSVMGVFADAAVSADGVPCATVAKDILLANGTAADAAIAGLFCVGVINTQSMGLGGGFFLTYYHRASRTAHVLDAREVAPLAATFDMYHGNSSQSRKGPLSIAVPGELRGYYDLYRKFGGGVPWSDLLEPAIRLCEEGHRVNWHLARALQNNREAVLKEPTMSVFVNPATGDVYTEGDTLHRPVLATTLRAIQRDPDTLYTGDLSKLLLQDLQKIGTIITEEDLKQYKPRWRTPVNISLSNGGFTLYSVPPPGSGLLLGFMLNILDDYNIGPDSVKGGQASVTYQRIVEALKYAYARRTQMGDEDHEDMSQLLKELVSESVAASIRSALLETRTSNSPSHYGAVTAPPPDDSGTAHFSLVDDNGDAVSVTSTVNLYFGSGLRSVRTGIVLNDEMDDFSAPSITNYFGIPPSPANFIKPGKRPLSSMAPSIIVDTATGELRLVLGAAGGTKIPSGIANVIINNLWLGMDIKQAVDARRIHHQLYPMAVMYEQGYSQSIVNGLSSRGHRVQEFDVGGSVVCAVSVEPETLDVNNNPVPGSLTANSDFRKSGHVDGY